MYCFGRHTNADGKQKVLGPDEALFFSVLCVTQPQQACLPLQGALDILATLGLYSDEFIHWMKEPSVEHVPDEEVVFLLSLWLSQIPKRPGLVN